MTAATPGALALQELAVAPGVWGIATGSEACCP